MNVTIVTTNLTALTTEQNKDYNAPYLYVTIELDSVTYDITSYLKDVPIIDRRKEVLPETISDFRATSAIFTVSNETRYFTPNETTSLFYGKDFFDAKLTVYSGFLTSLTDAVVTSQMVVYVEEIRTDTQGSDAKLVCKGVVKKIERIKVGEPLADGTADPLTYSGTQSFKTIVDDLFTTHGGLTAAEFSVQDVDLDFTDISFTNVTLSTAIAYLTQAASCEIFEDRFGKITISKFEPTLGGLTTVTLTDSLNIGRMFASDSSDDLIKKVSVDGAGSVYAEDEVVANTNGRTINIVNSYVQSNTVAADIVGRHIERFGNQLKMLQADIDFFPTYDLGDIVQVTETQSALVQKEYEIYRIILDVEEFKGIVYLLPSAFGANFGFFTSETTELSDPEAPEADNYDDADARDIQFCYFGDRTVIDDTPPKYLFSRR